MSLLKHVERTIQNLDRMRYVNVTIYYAGDASPQRREKTGVSYSNVLSENFIALPAKVDTLDTSGLDMMRDLWRRAVERQQEGSEILHRAQETAVETFARLLQQEAASKNALLDFIAAAKYPVPSEFFVILPEEARSVRKDIIGALVPFEQTRQMLLRLEDTLDLPMRHLAISHTRTNRVDELRATLN